MLNELKDKIQSLDVAQNTVNQWKQGFEKIVFTNGCFDILHRGHVEYLAQAKELGTKLVLGLNSDASVKRLKGNDRPLQDEVSRSIILASLACIDLVILFDEDTPKLLIDKIVPHILVKGGDYTIENIVGADTVQKNGGLVMTIDFVDGYSTTKIIKKMQ